MDDRLLLRVSEAAQALGLSRSKIYQLVAEGKLKTVHVGAAVRIPASELKSFVEQLAEQASAAR